MVGTSGIQQQSVIGMHPADPGLDQAGDVQGDRALILVREVGKVGGAAVEVPAGGGPALPGGRALIPIGGNAVDGCDLPGLVPDLIQVQRGAGHRRTRRDGGQVEFEQASPVGAVVGPDVEGAIRAAAGGR